MSQIYDIISAMGGAERNGSNGSIEFDFRSGDAYSESTHRVEIGEHEKEFGLITNEIYDLKLKRQKPWMVQGDRILYFSHIKKLEPGEDPPKIESPKDIQRLGIITVSQITAEELQRETISGDVADVLNIFKRVEDNLPYFALHAAGAFRKIKGLSRAYPQWDEEEGEHSNGAGFILQATNMRTTQELDDDYYKTQEQTWETPFEDPIEVLMYARYQEANTKGNYNSLANAMEKTGAKKCAYIIRKIAADEAYHGGGYQQYIESYSSLSPEHERHAAEAALKVAWNFRMPSMHLMRDRLRDTAKVIRTIGYNREQIEKMLRTNLNGFSFIKKLVPREVVEDVVTGYWDAEKARVSTAVRQQRRERGLVTAS